eukprot:6713320-Lingulodinium_polyedra.AAC.1
MWPDTDDEQGFVSMLAAAAPVDENYWCMIDSGSGVTTCSAEFAKLGRRIDPKHLPPLQAAT